MNLLHHLRILGVCLGAFLVTSFFAYPAGARPLPGNPPAFQYTDLRGPGTAVHPGLLSTAAPNTVYFGGTVWAADSARWEAIQDSIWTFDSGVGSHFNHGAAGVDPLKDPSLHAYMEGWVGFDRTVSAPSYFRRLPSTSFGTGQNQCVIAGTYSFWAGVLATEAPYLCYSDGQGYGNNWHVCIERSFTYNGTGNVTVQYSYTNDTEDGLDFTRLYVDTTGTGADVLVAQYTAVLAGTGLHTLVPGSSLRGGAGPFKLRFCVDTDDSYSDEDGLYSTRCGAFALDNVSVTGGGISYSNGFETDAGGWTTSPALPGPGGEWSDLVHVDELPPAMTSCTCGVRDTVLAFVDLDAFGAHGLQQNNFAASPWIDLKAAGLLNAPEKFLEMDLYADMPLLNYIYAQFFVQWYPYVCPTGGKLIRSPWVIDGITHYFGGVPTCTQEGGPKFTVDFSALMDLGAQQVRVGVGVFSGCNFYPNCTGLTNTSPWYDNIRFGVGGTFGAPSTPVIATRGIDLPQDAFPENGSLDLGATGRVDAGTLRGGSVPGPYTSLGDTLVVQGATGGAEVWVQLAVRPGPGINGAALTSYLNQLTFVENRRGLAWYAARLDTAEQGGVVTPGYWMTTFHESSPAFSGADTDKDGGDLDPHGGLTRLANDILPDDLFTPGTRLNLFYKTKFTASGTWAMLPDTTGGRYLEMEILPSSMNAQGAFNCVLYVEHAGDPRVRTTIEEGLTQVLPGTSSNYEAVRWDRFDVRSPSSHQATFGRPAGSEYGATLPQAMGYRGILWNSGVLDAFPLVEADASILMPWLLLYNQSRANHLYLSGDGLATGVDQSAGSDPTALRLLEDVASVSLLCGTYSAADCPSGTIQDLAPCVPLVPAAGASVSLRPQGGTHQAQGNGCPTNRSFDVLHPLQGGPYPGTTKGEERYVGSKTVSYASVSRQGTGVFDYRVVTDGVSVHGRREPAGCLNSSTSSPAVAERLQEVLDWFGLSGSAAGCSNTSLQTGVGEEPLPELRAHLQSFNPNPLRAGSRGRISFTLPRSGPARMEVIDLQGRVVRTLLDQSTEAGDHEAIWDGTDSQGRRVSGGVYWVSLTAPGVDLGKKLVVLRN